MENDVAAPHSIITKDSPDAPRIGLAVVHPVNTTNVRMQLAAIWPEMCQPPEYLS
jgi:hypothetical protein